MWDAENFYLAAEVEDNILGDKDVVMDFLKQYFIIIFLYCEGISPIITAS